MAAGPASSPKKGTGWGFPSLFYRSKPGTQKKSSKGEAGKGLLDGSISSSAKSSPASSLSSAKSSPASSRSSAKSVAAAAAASPPPKKPDALVIPDNILRRNIYNEANRWIIDNLKSANFPASVKQQLIAASKIPVKNTKIDAMRIINIKFIEEQRQLLEKYEQDLADYNKAIAAAPSGVAVAASGAAGAPKKSLLSIPAAAASKAAAAAAAAPVAAAAPGSPKIKGVFKIVPVVVTPKASAAASGWDAPPPAWLGMSSFSSTSPKSSSKSKAAFAAAAASKVKSSKSPKAAAAAAASGWGSVIGPALHDDSYSSAAPVSDIGWATPKAAAAKKSPSPSVGGPSGIKETVMINKYARMIVKYNQTHNPSDRDKATAFFNKNVMNKIPQEKLKYIPKLVQDLQDNPSGSESIMNNEKLLDDLADVIIEQENDNVANSLYPLYQMFEQGDIDEAIEYLLENQLWNLDTKLIDILEDNPTTRLRLLKLEEKPIAASWSSDDSSKGRKPKIMIKMKSPKSLSGAVPKLAPYTGEPKVKRVRPFTQEELAVINEFVRLMVLFNQTNDLRYVNEAMRYDNQNNMRQIPGLTNEYISSEIEKSLKTSSSVGGPSGAVGAVAAAAAVPQPVLSKKEKALKASEASGASASAAGESFLESILKDVKKHDKNEKKLKKYHRLVREGRIKEANAYSIKHKIAKIPGAFDKFESVMGPVHDGDDYVSVTPPIDSPVPLSPEVFKKAPLSFGQAAAMAAASGTPKAKSKGKEKGAIAGESPLSKLHRERVHRAVSPTYAPHDPKLAVKMG